MTQQEYHKLIEIYEVLDSGRIDMAKKMLENYMKTNRPVTDHHEPEAA